MEGLIFLVEERPGGGYAASALGIAIRVEAETMERLKAAISDAVRTHFADQPKRRIVVRLHMVARRPLPA